MSLKVSKVFFMLENKCLYSLEKKDIKLVILFLFDKMGIAMDDEKVCEILSVENTWVTYIDAKQALSELLETNLVYRIHKTTKITVSKEGSDCISQFYKDIPLSLRESITDYCRDHRLQLKQSQTYIADYSKNIDGTYTLRLKVMGDINSLMDLKLTVPNRQTAQYVFKLWREKASNTYTSIYEMLTE